MKNATHKMNDGAATGFDVHDHGHCRAAALSAAERLCAERKLKLTPLRRRVLEILLEAHEAMGAYDVLARLSEEGLGSKPPVAYRALGFWEEQGLVHRIERLNAYVACAHPGERHSAAFMICRVCERVAEAEPKGPLSAVAGASGFLIESMVLEAVGLCAECAAAEAGQEV